MLIPMADEKEAEALEATPVVETVATGAEPPVVARLVVEIRSDGSRTIARGALQDAALGHEVAIKAEGGTPVELAMSLVKSIIKAPFLGRLFGTALRSLAGRSKADERG
jgi:hypothetical protein